MTKIIWKAIEGLKPIATSESATRGAAEPVHDPLPDFLKDPNVRSVFEVEQSRSHILTPTVRSGKAVALDVSIEIDDDSDYLLVVRHPSGAISFHDGELTSSDGKRSVLHSQRPREYVARFQAPVGASANDAVRRGLLGDIRDLIVDAIVVKINDFVAETTVDLAEKAIWKLLKRKEGLHRVVRGTDKLALKSVRGNMKAGPSGRALLLIHGTFSTTLGSFGDLHSGEFFERASEIYGDAIYGFDHFSVSVTPEKNALDILKKLPAVGLDCDVITQSRGGLVLRNLTERADDLDNGDRFRLGRAALVASPNEGTPLATPDRWENTIGWIANILDLFPPNPVTTNAALIARWIAWFTRFGVNAAEGLDAMNMTGQQIRTLQLPSDQVNGKYSALVSNFEPDGALWARALDLGLDWFFSGANDLVVPTGGGFRVNRIPSTIPAEQIGVYGPGGNLDPGDVQVHHMNSFGRPQTQKFLLNALLGEPQGLPIIDPNMALPTSTRSSQDEFEAGPATITSPGVSPAVALAPIARPLQVAAQSLSPVFELMVVDPHQIALFGLPTPDDGAGAFLYAAYGGARITVPFWLKQSPQLPADSDRATLTRIDAKRKEVNTRRGKIFQYQSNIRNYLDGIQPNTALNEADLQDFGEQLFEFLLPDDVRRLYDAALSREGERLVMIFTSMIPWVADLPWEFARDPVRGTRLATEDVHFIRNVLTPTPVDKLPPTNQLRILVVTAEPTNLATLSIAEETAKLRHEMLGLRSAGLVEFDALDRATPRTLHHTVASGDYDVLHFIGHGYWNKKTGESGLLLEDESGQAVRLGGLRLREILTRRRIRLMFLNACDTGRGTRTDDGSEGLLGGVAQELFGRGVPNVIANQFPVGDRAAVAFARSIYDFLAHGKTVAESVREARIAANFERGSQAMDWAIPVVYARDPEDRLVESKG